MEKKVISAKSAPVAVGPYSVGIDCGGMIYLSGQIPVDTQTGRGVSGDIKEQTRTILTNIDAILNENGLSLKNVVKSTVYMTDLDEFAGMNEVYASFFTEPYPARSTIKVAGLFGGIKLEIEVIACKGSTK